MFKSSTRDIPEAVAVPRHIAIIMDGNGRWAKKRFLPRMAGHKQGVETVREVVKACTGFGVEYLTLFAFSSENWRRPEEEVSFLMNLFLAALEREVDKLHQNGIRLRLIGRRDRFSPAIVRMIESAEARTAANTKLTLTIAADYGGRWDMLNATQSLLRERPELAQQGFGEEELAPHLAMAYAPEPDLFIRTGGEQRISNFLLWQLAYSELYFTELLWPDFGRDALLEAIHSYQNRERRFGRTSEQLRGESPSC
ncbi:polyprenyl diphosphate synthase [Chitinimonas lacunae]|uniref:Isoprenyl transferase n=1 Tax=Chitinimonas lacunae TaxID=1963018 RepID=A0ABV8MUW4_9NEIS